MENPNLEKSKLKYLQDIVHEARARNKSRVLKSGSKELSPSSKTEEYGASKINRISNHSPEIISTKKLNGPNISQARNYSQDMSLVSKIVPAEVDDDKWLGEYKIKNSIRKNMKMINKE